MLQKSQIIELTIEKLVYGGEGLGRVDGFVVFVPGTVPQDRVRAQVFQRKKDYARARLIEVLQPSPFRITPPCPYVGECGGCRWQMMTMDTQVNAKRGILCSALGLESIDVTSAPAPFYYRNKMEFTFGEDNGKKVLGLHQPGNFNAIVDIATCMLQTAESDSVLKLARTIFLDNPAFSVYDKRAHTGLLRYLILRGAQGKVLVNVVTREWPAPNLVEFAVARLKTNPAVSGILWSISSSISDAVKVEEEKLLYGESDLAIRLGETQYRVGAKSFFQTNTEGTELLYTKIRNIVVSMNGDPGLDPVSRRGEPDEQSTLPVLLDLYCGVGSIGLYVADLCEKVIGVEIVPDAVKQATSNATLNHRQNCQFIQGDLDKDVALITLLQSEKANILVLDPPRGGIAPKGLKRILGLQVPTLLYVSCNPTTLARDIVLLKEEGYVLKTIEAIDLFPQTTHVETVAVFEKIQF